MSESPPTIADPIAFWEERHADLGPWRSGGDRGISNEENHEFYAYRLGKLIELIRRHAGGERKQRILDAGCGRGHFTHGLRQCGHRVTGIDTSATAIAWARESYGAEHFEVGTLDSLHPTDPFKIVLCIDVLFHILDDAEWRGALAEISRLAAAESVVILTDVFGRHAFPISNYIRHRSRAEYDEAMQRLDFRCQEIVPYAFGANPNKFAVYRRSYW